MKKLYIFDFDGTLFDSVNDVVECFNIALEIHNFPTLTKEEYLERLGGNIDEIVSLILGDKNTPENIEIIKKSYGKLYAKSKNEQTLPFPKTHEILNALQKKGIILAINSNRMTDSIEYYIEKHFPDIDFALIEGHNPGFPSKPDPLGVKNILDATGIKASEALYIGDSIKDIETSKNAGMDCVIVTWGYGDKRAYENDYPILMISEMDDLLKLG